MDRLAGRLPALAGVFGRVGAAVKVRGMFLHPRQVEAAMHDLDDVAAYQFVVNRVSHRDELRCQIVPTPQADATHVAHTVRDRVKSALRFTVDVDVVGAISEGPTGGRPTHLGVADRFAPGRCGTSRQWPFPVLRGQRRAGTRRLAEQIAAVVQAGGEPHGD